MGDATLFLGLCADKVAEIAMFTAVQSFAHLKHKVLEDLP